MSDNVLTRAAKHKILNGEQLRAAIVRVKVTDIRPPGEWDEKPVATVRVETVDAHGVVLSEIAHATVREGDSVSIAEIDRAFTFTLA